MHSELAGTVPEPSMLIFDGQELPTQRYITRDVVVDVGFLPDASLSVSRPANALELLALSSEPYESARPALPAGGEYFGYHAQRSDGGSSVTSPPM